MHFVKNIKFVCQVVSMIVIVSVRLFQGRDGRFGSKVGQIGPKRDKSGAFSDQISVHLELRAFSDQISVHLAPRAKCTEI